jgi:electron transfer flavoprotein alpha subunit
MSKDIWVVVETLRGEVLENTYTMLAAGRVLADASQGKLIAVLLGSKAEKLAGTLAVADGVTYVDDAALAEFTPDAYERTIAGLVKQAAPRAVLMGHSSMGMDVASGVSIELGLPLVSACQTLSAPDGRPRFVAVTCGGKVLAEGELPEPSCLVTMVPGGHKPQDGRKDGSPAVARVEPPVALGGVRVKLKGYVEPEAGDVDIAKESILVSVGRGIGQKDNIALAQELADALGGAVCASRPIVDQGWLPTTRLVGKSGKSVKPRLYLALGISGAPEHHEGMSEAECIVAVNTDEKAPILDFAQYGAMVDALKLLPALTARVKQAKGG